MYFLNLVVKRLKGKKLQVSLFFSSVTPPGSSPPRPVRLSGGNCSEPEASDADRTSSEADDEDATHSSGDDASGLTRILADRELQRQIVSMRDTLRWYHDLKAEHGWVIFWLFLPGVIQFYDVRGTVII